MIASAFVDALQVHGGANGLALTKGGGFGSPVPRRDSTARPSAHGELDRTRYYAGRVLDLTGRAQGATPAEAWAGIELLQGALALGSEHVFKFTRQGFAYAERCVVRVASGLEYDLAGTRRSIKWAVQLVAADPRFYADAESSGSYDPTTAPDGQGVVFPLTFPLNFAGAAVGAELTLENGGNFPTPPRWTIDGPAINPQIRNDTTGEAIHTIGLELLAGDALTIDVGLRDATIAGTSRLDVIDASATVWGELVPGPNVIRLLGSGFEGGSSMLTGRFRDARI